jgi:hypothetical protein
VWRPARPQNLLFDKGMAPARRECKKISPTGFTPGAPGCNPLTSRPGIIHISNVQLGRPRHGLSAFLTQSFDTSENSSAQVRRDTDMRPTREDAANWWGLITAWTRPHAEKAHVRVSLCEESASLVVLWLASIKAFVSGAAGFDWTGKR